MTFLSQTEESARLRREILESGETNSAEVETLQRQVAVLNAQVLTDPNFPVTTRQGINNLIRNSDHNHSVDTWFNTAQTALNQLHECANVYAYPRLAPISVTDAAMTVGSNILNCPTSNPFTAAMNGRWAIVEGAGAAAAAHSGIITYVSASQVTLSQIGGGAANAATTVTNASARINLQRFAHTNTKNTVATVNDALKADSHSDYNSNITDPDWNKTNGFVRLGGSGIVGYPFGRFASNGTTYVPLHFTFAGRELFARLNIARVSQYVKVKGKLFLGIYNNHELVLDFVSGSNLTLSSSISGDPLTTVSTEYMLVLETQQGFSVVSEVLTVADAPDNTGFNQGARVRLNWLFYAGATRAIIYRKRFGENVYKLETDDNPRNNYVDVNVGTRVDTGSTVFPTITNTQTAVRAFWATADGELDALAVDGDGSSWRPLEVRLPYPPSVNMSKLFDPHFVIGLTEPLATEVTDAVTDGSSVVTSVAAQFSVAMIGKTYILTNPATLETLTGTVSDSMAPNELKLDNIPAWISNGNILEIEDSQPNGLHFDCVGVSINDGEWEINPEDNSELRGQQAASNPNGSTQGSPTGNPPTSGGGFGGIDCVLDEVLIKVRVPLGFFHAVLIFILEFFKINVPEQFKVKIREKRAKNILLTDLLWNGIGYTDSDFNELAWIKRKTVNKIRIFQTESKRLPCTEFHRVVGESADFRHGMMIKRLNLSQKVLISDRKGLKLETVLGLPEIQGSFNVISFGMKKTTKRTGNLFVSNDVLSHNYKSPDI